MSDLLEKVGSSVSDRRLLLRGHRVLVAVSGGLDSMVLLHLLARLAPSHGWQLTVAHFNHRLRGRSSDADERLVRATAAKLGLPFVSASGDVRRYAKVHKLSVEMAARELRHGFLTRIARKRGLQSIALAHHADDQVELFFLKLFRGEGLAGMSWKGPSPSNSSVELVRPLLDRTKTELAAWAKHEKIAFREDASNASLEFKRNRIRHELLPLLKKHYQPSLEKVIVRQMDIAAAEAEFAIDAAQKWLKSRRHPAFESLALAVQRRCVQLQLVSLGVRPNFDLIERLRESANLAVSIDAESVAIREPDGCVSIRPSNLATFKSTQTRVQLKGRVGELDIGNFRVKWSVLSGRAGTFRAQKPANCEYFDADKVGRNIVLRHWRPGDRFQPIGMPGTVKLQDLFTNQKVLRERRRELMVGATESGELFWVEGLRLGERFKLDNSTVRQLKWQWKRV